MATWLASPVFNRKSKQPPFSKISQISVLMVLIEYVPFEDLLGYLRKSRGLNDTYYKNPDVKPETNLTLEQLMEFAWGVADGVRYLSSKRVCPTREVAISQVP